MENYKNGDHAAKYTVSHMMLIVDDVVRFVPDVDYDVGHLLQNLQLVTRVLP